MVFKIDFIDGKALEWSKNSGGVEAVENRDYRPRFYMEGDVSKLQKSRGWISSLDKVEATTFESWKPTLSKNQKRVLRIDTQPGGLKETVNTLKKHFDRTKFRFYNINISPQFRYCLQNQIKPVPQQELEKIEINIPRKSLANQKITPIKINNQKPVKNKEKALKKVKKYLKTKNPDIIIVNRAETLKLLNKELNKTQEPNPLTRLGSFEKLAGENTVSSYGKTVHSASRFNIPGRIIIDKSNSFMLKETTLKGLWDLVRRSYRPLQELAWASIGRILTSIEIKKAYLEENTLTPWKNWSGETPKKADTLHKADRGGFIFNPDPSIHKNVLEADFASLFPNIMVKKNISPETVCCSCCKNNKTPELDYSICEKKRGFIPKVLKPLVEDRKKMKKELEKTEDEKRIKYLEGSIDAIKWILVSCFGYMGHSHASYGAIECHQAIQSFDREIMVETKEMFEDNGFKILHGIIDSIWVQRENPEKSFKETCKEISNKIGIELEEENRFEWCGFVPRTGQHADIATLNRYFGKKENGDFKTAGIECEQKTTCKYVEEKQREMIKALDRELNPQHVLKVLEKSIEEIESGNVATDKLVRKKTVSKSLEDYKVDNRSVAGLKRAEKHGINVKPGQEIRFVVRDEKASSLNRVRLDFEAEEGDYDREFYREQLVKACESVLSPVNWSKEEIENHLEKETALNLKKFV